LEYGEEWTAPAILELMVKRVGVSADPDLTVGRDMIDSDLTLDRLDAMAAALRAAAERKQRVLVSTGHPSGIFAIHVEIAQALASRGCTLLQPAPGHAYRNVRGHHREIRHIGGVAMVSSGGELNHTHSPYPMEAMLAELAALGEPLPDLVVGDHGFAGAAGQAGVTAIGFADSNDPALFLGEAMGKVAVTVPLDDNVLPHLYAPLAAYLVAQLT
jgi:hypothetical protein